jgi:hypothetical protein
MDIAARNREASTVLERCGSRELENAASAAEAIVDR